MGRLKERLPFSAFLGLTALVLARIGWGLSRWADVTQRHVDDHYFAFLATSIGQPVVAIASGWLVFAALKHLITGKATMS